MVETLTVPPAPVRATKTDLSTSVRKCLSGALIPLDASAWCGSGGAVVCIRRVSWSDAVPNAAEPVWVPAPCRRKRPIRKH